MRAEHNLKCWPESASSEMEIWKKHPELHAHFPSYFGMTFLNAFDGSILSGSCDLQNGSAAVTIVEKVFLAGDKFSLRDWSDECTPQAWHGYVEFIVETLDLVYSCLVLNVIPCGVKLDNVGVVFQADCSTRRTVMIDLDGLRPFTKQNKGGTASKLMNTYLGNMRSLMTSNKAMLEESGWSDILSQLRDVIHGTFSSNTMKQETWEYLVAVNNNFTCGSVLNSSFCLCW